MTDRIKTEPKQIWAEFENGQSYKNGIGTKGIQEQAKINERFFIGDQWHGVNMGNEKPLTRRNIIRRIGEYKMSVIGSAPIAVNYSAEGIPDTVDLEESKNAIKTDMLQGNTPAGTVSGPEISVVMNVLSDYYRVTSERLKFTDKLDNMLKNAYISGTGLLYTYWDDSVLTGLYADEGQTKPIKGDIACEVLDVENVVFGDPNEESIEAQPYILIARRMDIAAVRRMARKYRQNADDIQPNAQDSYYKNAGEDDNGEPTDSRRVTVVTKLWKKYDKEGDYTVWGKTVAEKAVVRPEWDLKIHRYPIAKFVWDRRRNCAYGDSEITNQIPNQIALNQLHFFSVWAMQNAGMPKMIVNGDVVTDNISNDPGEIIKVFGNSDDIASAIRYVSPPAFSRSFTNFTDTFAQNILSDSGANDAALGDLRPDNATAIVQAREAAIAPMQMYRNRFYSAVEDVARIWADFWITMYGKRSLKINTENGTEYILFDAPRYSRLVINAKIDVGASTIWSEAVCITNLSNLLQSQLITFEEYLERLPAGIIPNVQSLINARKQASTTTGNVDTTDDEVLEYLKQTNPQAYEQLMRLSPEEQQQALSMMRGGAPASAPQQNMNPQMVGDM